MTAVHRTPSLRRPATQQAPQLWAEYLAGGDVDDDVAGVVWHAYLLYDGTNGPVGEMVLPRGVGHDVRRRAAFRKAEVDGVDDGDRKCHGDEVERDGE